MRKKTLIVSAVLAAGLLTAAGIATALPLPLVLPWPDNVQRVGVEGIAPGTLAPITPRDGRDLPLVVVLGDNQGAETTDFIVPYGILAGSGLADVLAVSTGPGPIKLFPALKVEADMTIANFSVGTPAGADVVIVPAMHRHKQPDLLAFIVEQHAKGALIVSICDGAWILAESGVLADRQATAHWFSLRHAARAFPQTNWLRDTRYVVDGNVMTTTGVSASIPASLAIVEAIGGTERANEIAQKLDISDWGQHHVGDEYTIDTLTADGHLGTLIANAVPFWTHERLQTAIADGVDEVALAFHADAWSRTYRSSLFVTGAPVVTSASGLRFLTSAAESAVDIATPKGSLNAVLADIADRYGTPTARFVALQLEYPVP